MNRFRKTERLCSKKQIETLLAQGDDIFIFPFRIVYSCTPAEAMTPEAPPCSVLIVAPKRHFKKAVMRNLLKRRTREAYRLHKQELYAALTTHGKQMQLFLQYVHNEELPYGQLEEAVKKIIGKLAHSIEQ